LKIQGDSGGKVNNMGDENIGHCEENFSVNMCLIRNDYRNKDIWNSRPNSFRLSFVSFGQRSNFTKENWINKTNFLLKFWVLLRARKKNLKIKTQTKNTRLRIRLEKCTGVVGRICEHLLLTAKKIVISTLDW